MNSDSRETIDIQLYKQYLMEEYVAEEIKLYKNLKSKKNPSEKDRALLVRIKEHNATIILYFAAIILNLLQCVMLAFCFSRTGLENSNGTYFLYALAKIVALVFCVCSFIAYRKQMYYNVEVYGQALSDISATMPIEEILNSFNKNKKRDWTIIVDWLRNRPSIIIFLFWLLTCIWCPRIIFDFLGYGYLIGTKWEWLAMIITELLVFISLIPKHSSFSYWYYRKNKVDENSQRIHVVYWEALFMLGSLFFIFPGVLTMLVNPLSCFIIILILAGSIYITLSIFSWNRIMTNKKDDKNCLTELHKLSQATQPDISKICALFNQMSSLGQIRFLEWLQSGNDNYKIVIENIDDETWVPKSDRVMVQLMNMLKGKKK